MRGEDHMPFTPMSMSNPIIPGLGPHRRIRRIRQVLESNRGTLTHEDEHFTELNEAGDILTTETESILVIDGEVIASIRDIKGVCQAEKCTKHLTERTFRTCLKCTKVICPEHSERVDHGVEWLCPDCAPGWFIKLCQRIGRFLRGR